jgi:hypothetical protein
MSEWKEYTGSINNVNDIINSGQDIAYKYSTEGDQFIMPRCKDRNVIKNILLASGYYLICNPHPRADMICQQARTGQPVWVKLSAVPNSMHTHIINNTCDIVLSRASYSVFVTCKPVWDIPDAEYSFTPFKD